MKIEIEDPKELLLELMYLNGVLFDKKDNLSVTTNVNKLMQKLNELMIIKE